MRISAISEKHSPSLLLVLGTFGHFWLARTWYPTDANELFNGALNLSGVAVGFLATGQGLLCSLSDNFVVTQLKKLGLFERLLSSFTVAIRWCLLLALFSMLAFCIDFKPRPFFFSLWIGIFLGAGAASYRVIHMFGKILHK